MKTQFLSTICYLLPLIVLAQPSLQWQRCYGGSYPDAATCMKQTPDGGYIVAGVAFSLNGDVSAPKGGGDFWIVKLDAQGLLEWEKSYGGTHTDMANAIDLCEDGGYIVAGHTYSNNGDVVGHHGEVDSWAIKLDHSGNLEWQRTLGGSEDDVASTVVSATDGGYLVAGRTFSDDGDVTSMALGYMDVWVVKLHALGEIEWERRLGGNSAEWCNAACAAPDGGFYLAGETHSSDGQLSGNNGNSDYWVAKISSEGELNWQRAFGGTASDAAFSVQTTGDGGCVVAGVAGSEGQVTGNHGGTDAWVIKVSSDGELEWQRALGGSDADVGRSIAALSTGGYALLGTTYSYNGDVQGFDGMREMWALQLDATGEIVWQKCLGGSQNDKGYAVIESVDGGIVMAAVTYSNDGDVSGNNGNGDYWIVKLATGGSSTVEPAPVGRLSAQPNPTGGRISFEGMDGVPLHSVKVFDLVGREVAHVRLGPSGTADLTALPSGLYIATAHGADGAARTGIIVKQ